MNHIFSTSKIYNFQCVHFHMEVYFSFLQKKIKKLKSQQAIVLCHKIAKSTTISCYWHNYGPLRWLSRKGKIIFPLNLWRVIKKINVGKIKKCLQNVTNNRKLLICQSIKISDRNSESWEYTVDRNSLACPSPLLNRSLLLIK